MTPAISDRFDLTLECIRRSYLDEDSPLASTLRRYAEFFALFGDFRGYADYFLLQDLVRDDTSVNFFLTPFDDFRAPATPNDIASTPTVGRASRTSSPSETLESAKSPRRASL